MSRVTQLGSARSLLLTVLGEFVHPNGSPVWTATLVDALQVLGVEEKGEQCPGDPCARRDGVLRRGVPGDR